LTGGTSRDEEPDVTPDGKWIVYIAWPGAVPSLWKLPLKGGTPQQVSRMLAGHPAVSPDGQRVLCQIRESYDGRNRYAIISLANGIVEQELWDLPVSEVVARWEPDGKAIDFVDAEQTQIWRKPLPDGQAQPITERMPDTITHLAWNQRGHKLAFATVRKNDDVVLFHRKITQ
jgi:Tol biopolymer transport system component